MNLSLLQATQREMASVLISDLYGKHLSQHDIAKGIVAPVVLDGGKLLLNLILIECGIYW